MSHRLRVVDYGATAAAFLEWDTGGGNHALLMRSEELPHELLAHRVVAPLGELGVKVVWEGKRPDYEWAKTHAAFWAPAVSDGSHL